MNKSNGPTALLTALPASYFPIRGGRYDVAPNLSRLQTAAFGNGKADTRVFQFDRDFARYRANILTTRRECFRKYVLEDDLAEPVRSAAARRIVNLLDSEYPDLFQTDRDSGNSDPGAVLHCALTGDRLRFDSEMRLCSGEGSGYADAIDALMCQVPEDVAIVRRTPERGDWVAALHVCAPSHWRPADKIGGSFDATHAPVPGMERIRQRASPGIVSAMIGGEPTVRFTWGIEFDDRLNHHPDAPKPAEEIGEDGADRRFSPDRAPTPLVLRVERQVTVGLPEVDAALFFIRVYTYDGRVIRGHPEQRASLVAALHSMSPESREYKSLGGSFDAIVAWLEETVAFGGQ